MWKILRIGLGIEGQSAGCPNCRSRKVRRSQPSGLTRAGARPGEGQAQVSADVVFAKLRNDPPAGAGAWCWARSERVRRTRGRQGAPDRGRGPAVLIEQGHVGVEPRGEPPQCVLLLGDWRGGGREHILHEPAERDARLLGRSTGEVPQSCGRENEQEKTRHQSEIEP